MLSLMCFHLRAEKDFIVQPSNDTLFMLSVIPTALSSAKHIRALSFFSPPPSDYLHGDLHLNGCEEYINNTYTNHCQGCTVFVAARHEWKKNSMKVL